MRYPRGGLANTVAPSTALESIARFSIACGRRTGASCEAVTPVYARSVDAGPSETRASRLRVGSIVFRCVRFQQLLAFWQAAIGYDRHEEAY